MFNSPRLELIFEWLTLGLSQWIFFYQQDCPSPLCWTSVYECVKLIQMISKRNESNVEKIEKNAKVIRIHKTVQIILISISTYQTTIHQWTNRLRTEEKHCSLSLTDSEERDRCARISTEEDTHRQAQSVNIKKDEEKRIDPSVRPFAFLQLMTTTINYKRYHHSTHTRNAFVRSIDRS